MGLISNLIARVPYFQTYNFSADNELVEKVVVLTGASKGMGRVIAKYLADRGVLLVLLARDIKTIKKEFSLYPKDQIFFVNVDLTNPSDIQKAIKKITEKFDKIDVLINNAGIFIGKPLENFTEREVENIISVNLISVISLCKGFLPIMKSKRQGLIINIGSRISHNSGIIEHRVLYATTKYGIEGFSYALNKESIKYGVRVVCLMPGSVNTYFSKNFQKYLSPFSIAELVTTLIKMKDIQFEGIIFQSVFQNS